MSLDPLQQLWHSSDDDGRLAIRADLLLKQVSRNRTTFDALILRRDFGEVAVALILIPVFIWGAISTQLWSLLAMVPACLWVAAFFVIDHRIQRRKQPPPGQTILGNTQAALEAVNHQIWLLRNVWWWYLLPFVIAMLAVDIHVIWTDHEFLWQNFSVAFWAVGVGLPWLIVAFIYWLNQYAVRKELLPRKQELQAIIDDLQEQ